MGQQFDLSHAQVLAGHRLDEPLDLWDGLPPDLLDCLPGGLTPVASIGGTLEDTDAYREQVMLWARLVAFAFSSVLPNH